MAIISAEQFREKSIAIISIPGFMPDETFEIKVKRLSIVGLISSGKIPNTLMQVVKNVFKGIQKNEVSEEDDVFDKAGEVTALMDIICREAMLEPRFEEISDVMNDAQKLAVFQFTQTGVQEVQPFRGVAGDTRCSNDVEDISSSPESDNRDNG